MKPRYSTVLFDADETIFDFQAAERCAFAACMEERGLPCTPEIYADYHQINDALWKALECREVTKTELKSLRFGRLAEKYGFTYDPTRFNLDYMAHLGQCAFLLDGAEDLCRRLREDGCRLYIITNGIAATQRPRFEKAGLNRFFTDVFISEDIGCDKPDRRFFETVFSRIEAFVPTESVVAGDSLSSDIQGANNAGVDSIWFNPHGLPLTGSARPTYTVTSFEQLRETVTGR